MYKKFISLPIWEKIPLSLVFFILIFCILAAISTKSVQFSYAGDSCARQLIFLPDLSKLESDRFAIKNTDNLNIFNLKLFSTKTCFIAKKAPQQGSYDLSVSLLGVKIIKKNFRLTISKPPTVSSSELSKPISAMKPLQLNLSDSDTVFDYKFMTESKSTDCSKKISSIYCDVTKLELAQGSKYEVKLSRFFNHKEIDTIIETSVETIDAASVVSSSISPDQIVYDKPKAFTFVFNKTVNKAEVTLSKISGDENVQVQATSQISDKTMTVSIQNDLERGFDFQFKIDNVESADGSSLEQPYILNFKTSDGPGVASINVGSYGISLSDTIVINFDQSISSEQQVSQFVIASGVPTSIWSNDNQVFIGYSGASLCADLNIYIKPGLISNYGVTQNDSWSYSTRTVCHTTSIIGQSKEGRSILAYTFGSGSQTILYVGAIHGNELSTKYLMEYWVDELELNVRNIPSDKKIVIIPTANPDGVAKNNRYNSNGVDLNRNFPTSDWQTDIYSVSNELVPGGGGANALSEPESQALANFTVQLQPRITISFHGAAGYTIGDPGMYSASLTETYASLTGYTNMTGNSGAFSYPITGSYDTWMVEKYCLTNMVVELSSNSYSEFYRNKPALWAMARS